MPVALALVLLCLGTLLAALDEGAGALDRRLEGVAPRGRDLRRLRLRRAGARAPRLPGHHRPVARVPPARPRGQGRRSSVPCSPSRSPPAPFSCSTPCSGCRCRAGRSVSDGRNPEQSRPGVLDRAVASDPPLRLRRVRRGHPGRRPPGRRAAGRHQPAAPGHLRPRRDARDRDARRDLLRRDVRRLDDVDPHADSGRGRVGHDVHRRLCHGPEGKGRGRARDRRGRLVRGRHRRAWSR